MTEQVRDRINLIYKMANSNEEIELPFKILVLADLNPQAEADLFDQAETIQLTSARLNPVFNTLQPQLDLRVKNHLSAEPEYLDFDLSFWMIEDFEPGYVSNMIPGFEDLLVLRESLCELIEFPPEEFDEDVNELLESIGLNRDDPNQVTTAIAIIDEKLSDQLNAVLHHPDFMALESAWRGLEYLVNQVDFHENCQVDVLSVSKDDLQSSFEDSPEVTQSPLYQLVYSNEFGQFGGRPYSVIVGDYQFGPNMQDMALLQALAKMSAIAHAPFLTAASAKFFGLDKYEEFSRMRDLNSHFSQPLYDKWLSFRATPDARYVGMCMPRFLLRKAYRDIDLGFEFTESFKRSSEKGLWGNAAFALAAKAAAAFANYRWFVNMVGEEHGELDSLKLETGRGASRGQIPTEVLISDRIETDLIRQGFIPVTLRKCKGKAGFYEAVCCKSPEENLSEVDAQLASQFSFILVACRFAHYLKVMQREHIGSWKGRAQVDQELNNWLKQYISDMDNPAPGVRARRPLRNAKIRVREIEGKTGWFVITINLTPHFKYLGQPVNLQEIGRLETS